MGKKLNRGFKTKSQKQRLLKVSASLAARRHCVENTEEREGSLSFAILNDHTYTRTEVSDDNIPLEDATQKFVGNGNWGEGRRIVELNVLAQGLSGCKKCGLPLQLSHALGITTYGLSALIKVSFMYICSSV